MRSYGPQITRISPLDVAARAKSRLLARLQGPLLGGFHWLSERGVGDRVFAQLARRTVGAFLYSLKIEVNRSCDMSCPMCYVRHGNQALELELLTRLFEQLGGCGVRVEILGGEPLLRADIVEVVERAHRIARPPYLSLYTNGTRATPELARRLKEAGLDAALVTLVSGRREVHDEFVGRAGSFDRTLAGLRAFRDAGVDTFTFTAIHERNWREWELLRDLARDHGVSPIFFQYVPQRADDPLVPPPHAWDEIKRWIVHEGSREHASFVRDFYLLTGNACSGGNFVLTVKADGRVQPCPFIDDLPLGDVRKDDLWTIYRRRYQGTGLGELKATPPECRGCTYESVCGGGCRAGNRAACGTYATRDRACLGPFTGPFEWQRVCERVPSFF